MRTSPCGSRTHYSKHAGVPMPMDIEWAKDGADGKLYIIQARPETVASQRSPDVYETYNLKGNAAPVIVTGRAVGEKIAAGHTRRIATRATLQPSSRARFWSRRPPVRIGSRS